MWSPVRKVPRFKWLSCEHAFSCSNNLYKHYRTFTDHRPQPKTVAKLKRGHRFISRQGLRPLSTESQTSGTFQRKAHQWWTRGTHSSADRKNYSNKPVHLRKVQEKIRRNQLWKTNSLNFASTYSEPFLLFQGKLRCLQALVLHHIARLEIQHAASFYPAAQASDFLNFWTSEMLKVPVRVVNSLACKTILSCCGGKVFKSTLMPMFVKRYYEAFLEFDLGLVSSFNRQYSYSPTALGRVGLRAWMWG